MRRLLSIFFAVTVCALGQDSPKSVQKIIDVKFADADRVASMIRGSGLTTVISDKEMHVIIVRGTPEVVSEVEAMIKKLDVVPVAPPDIELTVYLVSSSAQNAVDDLPKELMPTAQQLHGLFAYKSYRILQSFVMRARAGRSGSTSGSLAGINGSYDFGYGESTVSESSPRVVHINHMYLTVAIPTAERDREGNIKSAVAQIRTDIDVREGQKVVVGKSSVKGAEDAMILVVTAKVVE